MAASFAQATSSCTPPDVDAVFVTLFVAQQLCGLPVLAVRDILGPQNITRIPLAPVEVAGSLNMRGRIVTAIDLRRRLKLPPVSANAQPIAVVIERAGELYALLVDEVTDVLSLPAHQFAPNPPNLSPEWAQYSNGIYQRPSGLLVVLDVARLLAIESDAAWERDDRR